MTDAEPAPSLLAPGLILLLIACWLGGGVTVDPGPMDEWLQLLALPLLALAAWHLSRQSAGGGLQRPAMLALVLIALVPLLQLLPLPSGWWSGVQPRRALAGDLQVAGVEALSTRWSLAPAATEAALWALLPAMAAFLAAVSLQQVAHRRLVVKAVLLLVLANVLFAFFQAGLPIDSRLRLYPDSPGGFGGVLANTNHMATALIIGMVLAAGQAVHAWRRHALGRAGQATWLVYAAFAVACFLLLPLSTSRAGMVLALPALIAVLVLTGALSVRRAWRSKWTAALMLLAVVVVAVGVHAALGWMAIDRAEELRHLVAGATVDMARAHAPFGSGVGSFVEVFEQAAPPSLWLSAYVNHAHNEYVQWWLEAGWLGMLALAASLITVALAGWRIACARVRDGNVILAASCFVAVCAVLAHSAVDYPLRTTTLMATAAALAGLMLAALADARVRIRISPSDVERSSPR